MNEEIICLTSSSDSEKEENNIKKNNIIEKNNNNSNLNIDNKKYFFLEKDNINLHKNNFNQNGINYNEFLNKKVNSNNYNKKTNNNNNNYNINSSNNKDKNYEKESYEKYKILEEKLRKSFLKLKEVLSHKKPIDLSEKKIQYDIITRQIFKKSNFWSFVEDIPFKPKYKPEIKNNQINRILSEFEYNINNKICQLKNVIFKKIKHLSMIGYISKTTEKKRYIIIRKETINNNNTQHFYIKVLDERKSEIKYINDYSILNNFLNELYKEIADDSYNK